MENWEKARNWEISEALNDFEDDSYDFIGRDIWLKNGLKADFMRYRSNGHVVDMRFYLENMASIGLDELRDVIGSAGDLLSNEGFRPQIYLSTVDSVKPGYDAQLEGDYYLDPKADLESIESALKPLLPKDSTIKDFKPLVDKT